MNISWLFLRNNDSTSEHFYSKLTQKAANWDEELLDFLVTAKNGKVWELNSVILVPLKSSVACDTFDLLFEAELRLAASYFQANIIPRKRHHYFCNS